MKIGCCGFPTAMQKYFELFEVVEIQKTFYQPPSVEIVKGWREKAPENFEFTVKAWQVITHPPESPTFRKAKIKPEECGFFKPIKAVFGAWEVTKEIAKVLKAKFILFQTPKSFKDTKENIANIHEFFRSIERDFIFGWEARGWKNEIVAKICEELDLVHVVDPFESLPTYGSLKYFRIHKNREDNEIIWLLTIKPDYVLFNNPYMLRDAQKLKAYAGENLKNSKQLR